MTGELDSSQGVPRELAGNYKKCRKVELPVVKERDGRLTWAGHAFGSEAEYKEWAARLEAQWPVQYGKSKPHKTETISDRTKRCKQHKEGCWVMMDKTSLGTAWREAGLGPFPAKLNQKFRVDMYGNVVSCDASNQAMTAFEVDHIFPWSRGGCSVQANFAGVYWGANNIKRDKLLQGMQLGPDYKNKLQIGITPAVFVALFKFAQQAMQGRRDRSSSYDRIAGWLTSANRKGESKGELRVQLKLSPKQWANPEPEEIHAAFERAGGQNIHLPPQPTVSGGAVLIVHQKGQLKVIGNETRSIKEDLKELGFRWDRFATEWRKKAGSALEDVVATVRQLCQEKGIPVQAQFV